MEKIRAVETIDIPFLARNDQHISLEILKQSVKYKRVFIVEADGHRIGWLRYNLFWDNTPFMNMLYVLEEYQNKGYGTKLLKYFENQMKNIGFSEIMTSTLVHEAAIHFYLKHGYQVIGGFHPTTEEYEVILKKVL